MRLADLIEKLQDLHTEIAGDLTEDAADDADVRLAMQPNYPLQHDVSEYADFPWKAEEEDDDHEQQVVVWIPDGGQVGSAPYLPGEISAALGW